MSWSEILSVGNAKVSRIKAIMTRMDSSYVPLVTNRRLTQHLDSGGRLFHYDDGTHEMALLFLWKPNLSKWKVAHYGYIGPDNSLAAPILGRKIYQFLTDEGKDACYAIVPNVLDDIGIVGFYTVFKMMAWDVEVDKRAKNEGWELKLSKADPVVRA